MPQPFQDADAGPVSFGAALIAGQFLDRAANVQTLASSSHITWDTVATQKLHFGAIGH